MFDKWSPPSCRTQRLFWCMLSDQGCEFGFARALPAWTCSRTRGLSESQEEKEAKIGARDLEVIS